MKVSISVKSARVIYSSLEANGILGPGSTRVFAELHSAIKRATRARPALKKSKAAREKKKRTKAKDTKSVRAIVFARAGGKCECGCGQALKAFDPGDLDHFWGRGKAPQSVENCWLLTRQCHRQKTDWYPCRQDWLLAFARHCDKHAYATEAMRARRMVHSIALQVMAEGVSR